MDSALKIPATGALDFLALGALIISYGTGLFGWQEGGFRTPTAIAMIAEVVAVISLALGMAASTTGPTWSPRSRAIPFRPSRSRASTPCSSVTRAARPAARRASSTSTGGSS